MELKKMEQSDCDDGDDYDAPPPDLWDFEVFRLAVGAGCFNDEDGGFHFVNGERHSEMFSPEDYYMGLVEIPAWASHIEWCGK